MYEKKLAQFVDLTFRYIELNNSKNGNFVIDSIYPIGREINASTNKTDLHDITEILLKLVLNTIKQTR
jgi:hypothetical protein